MSALSPPPNELYSEHGSWRRGQLHMCSVRKPQRKRRKIQTGASSSWPSSILSPLISSGRPSGHAFACSLYLFVLDSSLRLSCFAGTGTAKHILSFSNHHTDPNRQPGLLPSILSLFNSYAASSGHSRSQTVFFTIHSLRCSGNTAIQLYTVSTFLEL